MIKFLEPIDKVTSALYLCLFTLFTNVYTIKTLFTNVNIYLPSDSVTKPKELSLVDELIEAKTKPKSKSRVSWARLLKRVFDIDVTKCNKCGGQIKIIAAIEDPKVIKKILAHLGLPTKAPTPWPVRGPPSQLYDYKQF